MLVSIQTVVDKQTVDERGDMFTNIDAHAGLGDDERHVEEEEDDLHADEQTDGRLGTLDVFAKHQTGVP